MKRLFWQAIFILFLFSGCTVNNKTGLIIISNLSDKKIENIKIGDITISYALNKGEKADFWFNNGLKGKISASGTDSVMALYGCYDETNSRELTFYKDDPECHFISNYQYTIDIHKINGKYSLVANSGYKTDSYETGISTMDFPAR
ncbi:MAG TPA: hypothetical protein PLO89_04395 [Spirochaetota bacterium]|nr:hypothetical protein [Spirochaetota bacterium]